MGRRTFRRIAAAARRMSGAEGLHRCPACGSTYVCPMEWEEDGDHYWRMKLRCAACDTWRYVRASNEEAEAFELRLDRQEDEIRRALARIDREEMQFELDRLVDAFEHDLIGADDFAR